MVSIVSLYLLISFCSKTPFCWLCVKNPELVHARGSSSNLLTVFGKAFKIQLCLYVCRIFYRVDWYLSGSKRYRGRKAHIAYEAAIYLQLMKGCISHRYIFHSWLTFIELKQGHTLGAINTYGLWKEHLSSSSSAFVKLMLILFSILGKSLSNF